MNVKELETKMREQDKRFERLERVNRDGLRELDFQEQEQRDYQRQRDRDAIQKTANLKVLTTWIEDRCKLATHFRTPHWALFEAYHADVPAYTWVEDDRVRAPVEEDRVRIDGREGVVVEIDGSDRQAMTCSVQLDGGEERRSVPWTSLTLLRKNFSEKLQLDKAEFLTAIEAMDGVVTMVVQNTAHPGKVPGFAGIALTVDVGDQDQQYLTFRQRNPKPEPATV